MKYQGEFENGVPIGKNLTFGNGIFEGPILDWVNFKGKFTYNNGDIFEGLLKHSIPYKGKMTYSNEEYIISISSFWNGFLCLNFTEIKFKNGCIIKRTKLNLIKIYINKIIITITELKYRNSKVIIKYSNGDIYSGEIIHNYDLINNGITNFYRNGFSTLFKLNGNILYTKWYRDLIFDGAEVIEILPSKIKLKYIYINNIGKTGKGEIHFDNIYLVNWVNNVPFSNYSYNLQISEDIIIYANKKIRIKCPICNVENYFNINKNKILNCNIDERNICCICYENPVDCTLPECRHTFCSKCLIMVKQC